MIEISENTIQIVVLLICLICSLRHTAADGSRTGVLLSLFYVSYFLGDIYWTLCLFCFGETPQFSLVSNLSWYASFIFMYLLILQLDPSVKDRKSRLLPWIGPVFTAAMGLFYMQWGKILSNLADAFLQGLLLFALISRITDRKRYERQFLFCLSVFAFILFEYGMWTVSCFWAGDTMRNPYYWFDTLVTASFPLMLFTLNKAVDK